MRRLRISWTSFSATWRSKGSRSRRGEESRGLADGHPDDLADVKALDPDAQGPGVEAGLGAGRAGDVLPVAAEEDPDLDLVLLGLEPVEKALDAVVAVAALEDEALVFGLEVPEGDVGRDAAAGGPRPGAPSACPWTGAWSRARPRPARGILTRSGTILSSSTTARSPKPWHSGQAPWGLLKEKRLGKGSSAGSRQALHSSLSEKRNSRPSSRPDAGPGRRPA